MSEEQTETEVVATTSPSVDASENVATPEAVPALKFEDYMSALPDEAREMYTKNGVDSFDKQTSWVNGLNELRGKKSLTPPGEDEFFHKSLSM